MADALQWPAAVADKREHLRAALPGPDAVTGRAGGAERLGSGAVVADARDHGERPDALVRGDAGAPARPQGPRSQAGDRRLRDGLLFVRLPAAVPDRPAEDRPLLRGGGRHRGSRSRARARHHRPGPDDADRDDRRGDRTPRTARGLASPGLLAGAGLLLRETDVGAEIRQRTVS